MVHNLFSVPIFFIVFREALEASIIVSVLLGLVEQIVLKSTVSSPRDTVHPPVGIEQESPVSNHETQAPVEEKPEGSSSNGNGHDDNKTPGETTPRDSNSATTSQDPEDNAMFDRRLVRKLRWQIFLGAMAGFLIAAAIAAAFIAVWFTKAADLWSKSENLWEGVFSLIASIVIFIMGITMLKMDRAKAKWKVKLQHAFEGKHVDSGTLTGKWVLFFLPFITVLREGMEAVIFVGGVSLGQTATSIPIAALAGIVCGLAVGYIIYAFSSRTSLSIFLIVMTNLLLLIGAGLLSKAVAFFEANAFTHFLGASVDDSGGDGPGSYNVNGNVWHLDCCNPENKLDGQGWNIFAAVFGWTNSASIGTVLSYVFYWIAVIVALVYLKWNEGRMTFFGYESKTGKERRLRRMDEAKSDALA